MLLQSVVAGAFDQQIGARIQGGQAGRHPRLRRERCDRRPRPVHAALGHDHGVEAEIRVALEQLQHTLPDCPATDHRYMQHLRLLLLYHRCPAQATSPLLAILDDTVPFVMYRHDGRDRPWRGTRLSAHAGLTRAESGCDRACGAHLATVTEHATPPARDWGTTRCHGKHGPHATWPGPQRSASAGSGAGNYLCPPLQLES